jgi:uncharacterized protein with HEPN domain
MPRTEQLYLRDMIDAADLISDYVGGCTFEAFQQDRQLQDSLLYRLIVIGEAVAHVSETTRLRYPHIQWQDIVGFRNFAVHGYFALNIEIAWNAATYNVPLLRRISRGSSSGNTPPDRRARATTPALATV